MTPSASLASELLAALETELRPRGLRLQKRRSAFVRRGRGIAHVYQLVFLDYPPAIDVNPHVAVRHDIVEAILHTTSGFPPDAQRESPTVGGAVTDITGDPKFRVTIMPRDDRGPALRVLLAGADWAEGFFERFSDLANIDRELNDDPRRPTPVRPMPWLRCSTGAIVARLVERPDFERVIEIYRAEMRTWSNGFYAPRFEALIAVLLEHSIDELRRWSPRDSR